MAHDRGTTPAALNRGDTVALVSPSSRLNDLFPFRIARAKEHLEQMGYQVKVIWTPKLSEDFVEANKQRCDELHAAFKDTDVKAIICTIGGLSANELLPHLDYDTIKANPKIFCGYSDITLLHHAFLTQASLRTFYGPAAITQFGEYPGVLDFTQKHFLKVLHGFGGFPPGPMPRSQQWTQEFLDWSTENEYARARQLSPSPGWQWLRPGNAEGRLFGGCLPSVAQLGGTKYMIDYTGKILFLETPEGDAEGRPFGLDFARSSMADLRNIGILEKVAGLVLGRPYQYDEAMRADFEKMVVDQCYGTSFPILANVDVGHTDPMLTLPLNAMAVLDSKRDLFGVSEPVVLPRNG